MTAFTESTSKRKLPDPVDIETVLAAEKEVLKERRKRLFNSSQADSLGSNLFGVCFSGGGIRSATFNLGILQGLASQGLLGVADYLSTVSGGGYIGGWLHGVIKREPYRALKDAADHQYDNLGDYLKNEITNPDSSSRDPISFLRKYSNYLSPELGLLSSDTWVIATTWLRNTLLNQLILTLAIAAVMLLAVIIGNSIIPLYDTAYENPLNIRIGISYASAILGLLVLLLVGWVVIRINTNLSAIVRREFEPPHQGVGGPSANTADTLVDDDNDNSVWYKIVIPLWLGCVLLSLLMLAKGGDLAERGSFNLELFGWILFIATVGLFAVSLFSSGFLRCYQWRHRDQAASELGKITLGVTTVVACSCVTFALLVLSQRVFMNLDLREWPWLKTWIFIALGPFVTCLAIAAGVTLEQGLAGVDLPDSAREWYSRVAAKIFIAGLFWVGWFGISVFAPLVVLWSSQHASKSLISASLAWLASTAAAVISGKSPATSGNSATDLTQAKNTSSTLGMLAKFGPPIALIGTLIAIATGCFLAINAIPQFFWSNHPGRHAALSLNPVGTVRLAEAVVLIGVAALLLSTRANINEFSMNHFYMNRLVRCYLGASHGEKRRPNRFTGFDPKDDFRLAELLPANDYLGPYAIVNCTLNLNHGQELAWQERKATSFVFTPKYCGYLPSRSPKGFVETINFAEPGGPYVGMATAISGAAASPNWGSHTQPTTAFLLTMFNVRLGSWLGNTRFPERAINAGPKFALKYLTSELLGFADEDTNYVNLSDGGHFENLGLYELARRKCRFIIVGDGEQDQAYQFESLGGAIRKIRIDFGHSIEIFPKRIFLDNGISEVHCALGEIRYNDDTTGILLYLKSSLTGDEPYDVTQHKRADPNFPQDTTLNQFFTESMFESYRALGRHVVDKVFQHIQPATSPSDLTNIFKSLEQSWPSPVTAESGSFTRHAQIYSSLISRLSADDSLNFLDAEIFPGASRVGYSASDPAVFRKARLFIMEFLQLMEDVYIDLNLEDETQSEHPANSGWMELFRHWKVGQTFRDVWEEAGKTYGNAFRRFYGRL